MGRRRAGPDRERPLAWWELALVVVAVVACLAAGLVAAGAVPW